jgi:predicted  nucleic acid-binding Zn-ribbon protein
MSESPISSNFTEYCEKTHILCTRCGQVFNTPNPFLMTCSACHQRDVDYTVRLGNQTRMFQIEVALMNIEIELTLFENSDDRKIVLDRLVAQLEEEKRELSQNI